MKRDRPIGRATFQEGLCIFFAAAPDEMLTIGQFVSCQWYVALDGCEQHRDPVDIKTWGKHD